MVGLRRKGWVWFAQVLAVAALLVLWPRAAHAGYTHYWHWSAPPPAAELKLTLDDIRKLVLATKPGELDVQFSDASVTLNGIGDDGFETFMFPGRANGDYCKTGQRKYDRVVTAALLAARARFSGRILQIGSDGDLDDWAEGRELYRSVLGQSPPDPFVPPLPDDEADEPATPVASVRPSSGRSGGLFGGLLPFRFSGTLLMALAYLYFTTRDSRGGGGFGASAGSYYLFWLVGPTLLAIFSAHPAFLGIVVVGLVARRWLPDPFLSLRYLGRTRRLQAEIRVNRANVTARRDLAVIWLEKRRPKRALPLVEEALVQDASSSQLLQLRGVCLLGLRRYEEAVQCFVEVVQRDPGYGFGEPYLRAADALIALKRWEDAEDALEHFVLENRSSVEGQYKRALVARGRGDRAAYKEALRAARELYREVPRYQQRRQLAWYVRALFASIVR